MPEKELPAYLDTWPGMEDPNYTPVPDNFFDVLLPLLSDAEVRVLLYLIRRTYGFKKPSDQISLSQIVNGITTHDGRQLDRGAGLSRPATWQALRRLEARGIILVERRTSASRGNETNTYAIRKAGQVTLLPRVGNQTTQGRQPAHPDPGNGLTSQETVQETENKKDRDLRCNALAGVIRAECRSIRKADLERIVAAYRDAGGDYLAWWQQWKRDHGGA